MMHYVRSEVDGFFSSFFYTEQTGQTLAMGRVFQGAKRARIVIPKSFCLIYRYPCSRRSRLQLWCPSLRALCRCKSASPGPQAAKPSSEEVQLHNSPRVQVSINPKVKETFWFVQKGNILEVFVPHKISPSQPLWVLFSPPFGDEKQMSTFTSAVLPVGSLGYFQDTSAKYWVTQTLFCWQHNSVSGPQAASGPSQIRQRMEPLELQIKPE